jgi:hypothetical protein
MHKMINFFPSSFLTLEFDMVEALSHRRSVVGEMYKFQLIKTGINSTITKRSV